MKVMVRIFRILIVTLVGLSFSLAACSSSDSDASPPYEVSESTISHETTQEIGVWAPTTDGTWPIISISHGMGGNHENMRETASRLAEEGFVVFAADYTSTLGAPPDATQIGKDAECGWRYSLSVAEQFGGDPTQPVTFVGFSFGATVAMEGALNADFHEGGTYDACFAGVPHADILVGLAGCYIETPEGFPSGFNPTAYQKMSGDVDIVLVGGSEDDECEAWQSSEATEMLADIGFDATYEEIDGANHFEIVFHDLVDGEYITVADAPEGEQAVQIILEAIASLRP